MPDLSIEIAGVRLANPLVLASGIWGTTPELLERAARAGAGAVTAKTCTPGPRRGHRNPTALDWGHGLLNAMGLPNPGAEEEAGMLAEARRRISPLGVALIASIAADTVEGFAEAASIVSRARPELIEVNISCPNVAAGHGEMFAASPDAAAEATRAVKRATSIPCLVKLSPQVADIAAVARAVAAAGADGITAVNTLPGMLVDAETGLPILANRTGGISGPALKPVALRCVYEVCAAVGIPVIGTGGVGTGVDALEMISVGATAVGVGTAVAAGGEGIFARILDEMGGWMIARGFGSLAAIRGRAHRAPPVGRESNLPPVPGWRPA
ncbi:MAG: dihydroorotate dehydrogenase [Spirochaetes bacterium]|nr:dihydroorotate dehydrogenase [Spirochaetota bacterium]